MSTTTDALLLSVAMAAASGFIGSFAVMKRMAIAADPLSHVALPGIGIALALQINPMIGAAAMLVFGALLVWAIEDKARAATETVIGVVFSAALAIGSIATKGEDLIDALFGAPGVLGTGELVFGIVMAAAIVAFILIYRNQLIVALVSPDVARTAGIPVRRLELMYLEAFALTIALGLRFLGVLLMGALIIVPAATGRRLAGNLSSMLSITVAVSVISTLIGAWLGMHWHRQTGPLIVLVATGFFLLSLLPVSRSGRQRVQTASPKR
jgi:ABC-type Mn2+/Zn2+ transport system permease subunit